MNILLTGATGLVGNAVTHHLQQYAGEHRIFYAVRQPASGKNRLPAQDWQIRQFDFGDTRTYEPALQQIDRLFLLRPPQLTDVKGKIIPLLECAKRLGVQQIVFLSIQGVLSNTWTPHYKIEKAIEQVGIPYIFLRAGFFMQNLTQAMLPSIRERDEIFVPAAANQFSFVDVEELGEVAAKVLVSAGHDNKAYTLVATPPTDYYQVASLLSGVLEREIHYRNPSVLRFIFRELTNGQSLPFILVMIMLYRYTKLMPEDQSPNDLQSLLSHPPKQLQAFIEEHAEEFQPK
jgi:uncharacterized protein YbjT (DUF2867 family)